MGQAGQIPGGKGSGLSTHIGVWWARVPTLLLFPKLGGTGIFSPSTQGKGGQPAWSHMETKPTLYLLMGPHTGSLGVTACVVVEVGLLECPAQSDIGIPASTQ